MRDRISVLVDVIPRYGEMLLGVGGIALQNRETLLEDSDAREEIKRYLLEEATKKKNLMRISNCERFQSLMYKYTGKVVNIGVLRGSGEEDRVVNILMIDFFVKVIWPILVEKYINGIYDNPEKIVVSINIKRNVYLTIYDEDNVDLFFKEFKAFLLCNCIIISEATHQSNGDLLLKLMLPIVPSMSFGD